MKKLFLFTLLNLLLHSVFAQTWTQKSNFPGGGNNGRMASTSFSNNQNSAFVLGGLKGNVRFHDFWQYDAVNDTWLQKPNFPGGTIYGHISFVIDSMAYVGFGVNQSGNLGSQFWAYNMNTEVWSRTIIAPFPGDGRIFTSAMTINSKGYVGGGAKYVGGNMVYLDDFWEYDPILNTWTQKANYPGGLRAEMISFGIGNKGYMGYGENSSSFLTDFHEYNPTTDVWTLLPGSPSSPIAFGSVVTVNNKAYILGGEFQNLVNSRDVWEFTASNNSWQQILSFPDTPRHNAITFVLNNNIYYGMGQFGSSSSHVTDDLWMLGDLVTSINSELSNNGVLIYPNPFQNNIRITDPDKIKTLNIYNTQGQVVYSKVNMTTEEINLSFLSTGLYVLKVVTHSGLTMEEKLIKQ